MLWFVRILLSEGKIRSIAEFIVVCARACRCAYKIKIKWKFNDPKGKLGHCSSKEECEDKTITNRTVWRWKMQRLHHFNTALLKPIGFEGALPPTCALRYLCACIFYWFSHPCDVVSPQWIPKGAVEIPPWPSTLDVLTMPVAPPTYTQIHTRAWDADRVKLRLSPVYLPRR